ncbi:lyase family protein [Sulfitobacter sabulilitoris]|uniref:Adenylosuccinate lyase family protein n=1 Tax=Sulfitobacter sabulilitoris TaxID=2562655 RepID=A0A5S3PLQ1_9RHOB|nr:lyase family protein [Sulfitobacter sabulilitoris]TMM55354.1 adenylosuccinate lyase family protein [Sulfitobacter sabulilitoris]
MAASPFDSPLYAQLFPTGEAGRLFSDSAALRAMLLVEGALAKVQGSLGVIPDLSAAAIHRASLEIQIDPGAVARAAGENGVPVPGIVAAFRHEMQAPEHAQFVHWGATSQDVMDTALMLRLRQCLALAEADLRALLGTLADQADAHAETPMPARTYGQHATPTSWGAVIATWGMPLADAVDALDALRHGALWVSLSGAAGTASALGPQAAATRKGLAEALGLGDPGRGWHTDRGPVLRIADWMARITATLGAMGSTLISLSSSDCGEVGLGAAGASSTMPQKQNPVGPSVLVSLANQTAALRAGLQTAATHQHQRDAAAWFTEWALLPQICLATATGLQQARAAAAGLSPDTHRMAANLDSGLGLIHAEALSFALAEMMPRPQAQAAAKALCQKAVATQTPLPALAHAAYADLPATLFDARHQLGTAPADARAFVARIKAI